MSDNWGEFGSFHAAILRSKLRGFAGERSGLIVPGTTSGRAVVSFKFKGDKVYIAENASWEAVRFLADNLDRFDGARPGPGKGSRRGPIVGFSGVSLDKYPISFCIYMPEFRGKV